VAAAGLDREAAWAAVEDDAGRLRAQPTQAALWTGAGGGGDRLGPLAGGGHEEVIETLVAVPGVGRWTAEIYAKFALGHADVFAAGDLALQESARRLFDLPDAAQRAELRAMAGGLGAGARGCCPGAVGLLPVGHRPGGRLVSRVLEFGRKGPVAGSAKSIW
jgi:hypothetical protein